MYKVKNLTLKSIFDDSEMIIRLHTSQKIEVDENSVAYIAGSMYKIIDESPVFEAHNVKVFKGSFDGNLARCVDQREAMLEFVESGINPDRYSIDRTDRYTFMTTDEIAAEIKAGNWIAVKGVGLLESEDDLTMLK